MPPFEGVRFPAELLRKESVFRLFFRQTEAGKTCGVLFALSGSEDEVFVPQGERS